MKKTVIALSLALALPTLAMAEEDKKRKGPRMDLNGDGYITKSEMLEAHKKRIDEIFKRGDTNGDGKLDRDEMKAAKKGMREKMKSFRENRKERRSERQASEE